MANSAKGVGVYNQPTDAQKAARTSTVPASLSVKDVADMSGIVQMVTATTTTEISSATTIPKDNTIPQNTEGVEILTATITPLSTNNTLVIEFDCPVCETSAWSYVQCALFRDSIADALQATMALSGNSTPDAPTARLRYVMAVPSTSAQTYKIRMGASSVTIYVNRVAAGSSYSTIPQCNLTITEIGA